jgi:energy-coupling factor transport system substrate-specific component
VSPRLLALIPSAVAINLAMGRLVAELNLPVYLDTLGTVLAAALAGIGAGIATGLLSQVLIGLVGGYIWLAFAPIQVIIALLAAVAAWRGGFRSAPVAVGWGAIIGLTAGAASALISYFAFEGVTVPSAAAVVTFLVGVGFTRQQAVVLQSVGSDVVDKAIVFLLAGAVLRTLPTRLAGRFPWALRAVGR